MIANKRVVLSIALLFCVPVFATNKFAGRGKAFTGKKWPKVEAAAREELNPAEYQMLSGEEKILDEATASAITGYKDAKYLAAEKYQKNIALIQETEANALARTKREYLVGKQLIKPTAELLQKAALVRKHHNEFNGWFAGKALVPVKYKISDTSSFNSAVGAVKRVPKLAQYVLTAVARLEQLISYEITNEDRMLALSETILKDAPYMQKVAALQKLAAEKGLVLNEATVATIARINSIETLRVATYNKLVEEAAKKEQEELQAKAKKQQEELQAKVKAKTAAVQDLLTSTVIRNLDQMKAAADEAKAKAEAESIAKLAAAQVQSAK